MSSTVNPTIPDSPEMPFKSIQEAYLAGMQMVFKFEQTEVVNGVKPIILKDLDGVTDNYVSVIGEVTGESIADVYWGLATLAMYPRKRACLQLPAQIEASQRQSLLDAISLDGYINVESFNENWVALAEYKERESKPDVPLGYNFRVFGLTSGDVKEEDRKHYIETFVSSFGADYPQPDSRIYAKRFAELSGVEDQPFQSIVLMIEDENGQGAACAGLFIFEYEGEKYALFHGDATVESHRGYGLQTSLIQLRKLLCEIYEIYPEHCFAFVEAGEASERNYSRQGFGVIGGKEYIYQAPMHV